MQRFEVPECYKLRPVVQSHTNNFRSGPGTIYAFLCLITVKFVNCLIEVGYPEHWMETKHFTARGFIQAVLHALHSGPVNLFSLAWQMSCMHHTHFFVDFIKHAWYIRQKKHI